MESGRSQSCDVMEEAEPNSAATRHDTANVFMASVDMVKKFWLAD